MNKLDVIKLKSLLTKEIKQNKIELSQLQLTKLPDVITRSKDIKSLNPIFFNSSKPFNIIP